MPDPYTGDPRGASDGLPLPAWFGGSVCNAWDLDSEECQAAVAAGREVPRWCTAAWCYVDGDLCDANDIRSDADDIEVDGRGRGLGLEYSYQTCGAVNSYTPAAVLLPLREKVTRGTLRVGYPGNENFRLFNAVRPLGAPLGPNEASATGTGVVGPLGSRARTDVTTPIGGAAVQFLSTLLPGMELDTRDQSELAVDVAEGGFRRAVSAGSALQYPSSSYTACVADVAAGSLDFCVGPFWVTSERIALPGVTFTTPFGLDTIVSVSKYGMSGSGQPGWLRSFADPFRPFSLDLWALVFCIIVFLALVYYAVENPYDRMEVKDSAPWTIRASESVYRGFAAALNMEFEFNRPRSLAGRIVLLSTAFFVMIMTSSYTANLASTLVADSNQVDGVTAEDAVSRRLPVCGYDSLRERVISEIGIKSSQYIGLEDATAVLAAVAGIDPVTREPLPDGSPCDVALVSAADWQVEGALGDSGFACSLILTDSSVFDVTLAYPVSFQMAEALSWITTTFRMTPPETSFRIVDANAAALFVESTSTVTGGACRVSTSVQLQGERTQLVAADFAGLAIILTMLSLFSSVVQLLPALFDCLRAPGQTGAWNGVQHFVGYVPRENDLKFLRSSASRRAKRTFQAAGRLVAQLGIGTPRPSVVGDVTRRGSVEIPAASESRGRNRSWAYRAFSERSEDSSEKSVLNRWRMRFWKPDDAAEHLEKELEALRKASNKSALNGQQLKFMAIIEEAVEQAKRSKSQGELDSGLRRADLGDSGLMVNGAGQSRSFAARSRPYFKPRLESIRSRQSSMRRSRRSHSSRKSGTEGDGASGAQTSGVADGGDPFWRVAKRDIAGTASDDINVAVSGHDGDEEGISGEGSGEYAGGGRPKGSGGPNNV